MTAPKYVKAEVNSEQDVEKFISALRSATKSSKDSGGLYTAFLTLRDGTKLAVEIGLPMVRV